jgi:hypothetical protein
MKGLVACYKLTVAHDCQGLTLLHSVSTMCVVLVSTEGKGK